MRWIRHVALGVALVLLVSVSRACGAQMRLVLPEPPQGTPPTVYLAHGVRQQLQSAWDVRWAQQPERMYCLQAQRLLTRRGDSAWVVLAATLAVPEEDSPYTVVAGCHGLPTLHTHTPTTCPHADDDPTAVDLAGCVLGGRDGNIGWPSGTDRLSATLQGAPFDMIQFGRNAFVVYFGRPIAGPLPEDR